MKLSIDPARRWPVIIISVLLAQIGFGIWMARLAGNDPHHAVEPDYYQKAVNWDSTMAQSRRDRALGWNAATTLTRTSGRAAALQVAIVDSLGAALTVDSVSVEALAIAHASTIETQALTPTGAAWIGTIADAGNGLWEVRVRAVRGTDVFTARLRTELQ
ncbi:MAG: FixH family protein [Gemmatimonadaceae bacterium]|nr:FixH family protein [Gemmatimonadaceae bacterium]